MIGVILSAAAAADDDVRATIAAHREDGARVEPWVAWESGQAAQLTAALLRSGVSRLVVMGGDGTIHEAVNALRDNDALDQVALAVVPGGTGNDFVRALEHGTQTLAQALLASATRDVDLIDVGGCVGVNAVTFGAGTGGTRNASPRAKQIAGGFAYAVQALRESGNMSDVYVEIETEGGTWDGDVWGVAVCNGTSVGGGLCVAPDASLDDGMLDVAVLPATANPTVEAISTLLSPAGSDRSTAIRFRSSSVRLTFSIDTPMHVDGEPSMIRTAKLDVLPAALTLLIDDSPIASD